MEVAIQNFNFLISNLIVIVFVAWCVLIKSKLIDSEA